MILAEFAASLEHSTILNQISLPVHPNSFCLPKIFDLSKAPLTYQEAVAHFDSNVWHMAMKHELDTLHDWGVFCPMTLPTGRRAIGTRWVYAYKLHPMVLLFQAIRKLT